MLRFSLLARLSEGLVYDSSCWVFPAIRAGDFVELWVRCSGLREALGLLEEASSRGSVLAFAGLSGWVGRFLPASESEFVRVASSDRIVDAGVETVFEVLGPVDAALAFLTRAAAKLRISPKESMVEALLSSPLYVSTIFDNGLRLLKPFQTPPRLIANPRRKRHAQAEARE